MLGNACTTYHMAQLARRRWSFNGTHHPHTTGHSFTSGYILAKGLGSFSAERATGRKQQRAIPPAYAWEMSGKERGREEAPGRRSCSGGPQPALWTWQVPLFLRAAGWARPGEALLCTPAKGGQMSFCVASESWASCSDIISYITLAAQAARKGQSRFINVVLTLIMFVEQCCKEAFWQACLPLADVPRQEDATSFFPSFAYQNRTPLSTNRKRQSIKSCQDSIKEFTVIVLSA